METLTYILKKFRLRFVGCECGHLPCLHDHEVRQCSICPTCERYVRRDPLEIVNYGRDQLPELFHELGFKIGAEIGVFKGEYSEVFCKTSPDLHLLLVDPWRAYKGYRLGDQKTMDIYHGMAMERLAPYSNFSVIRKFSVEAAKDIPDESLDFVYIDAAHDFVSVVKDLDAWTPKVRTGGIISGHDYVMRGMGPKVFGKASRFHVKQAVDAWTLAFLIDPWFLIGRKEIREGEIRDNIRSFMWVKE